ncbi:MAG: hypothetical protein Salg2KO_01360 [Salibacteraceae bacterium]
MIKPLTVIFASIIIQSACLAQSLTVDAGDDLLLCLGHDSLHRIGMDTVAHGGTPPYAYEWYTEPVLIQNSPQLNQYTGDFLDDTTAANPKLINYDGYGDRHFVLTVTDSLGATIKDTMSVWYCNQQNIPLGYNVINVHVGDTVTFRSFTGLSCEHDSIRWTPKSNIISGLTDSTIDVVVDDLNFSHAQFTATFYSKGCVDEGIIDPIVLNVYPLSVAQAQTIDLKIRTLESKVYLQSNNPIDRVEIFDLAGRSMLNKVGPDIQSVDHTLSNGIYLLKVESNGNTQVKKIWLGS